MTSNKHENLPELLFVETYEVVRNDIQRARKGSTWEEVEEYYRDFLREKLAGVKFVFHLLTRDGELRIGDVLVGSSCPEVRSERLQRIVDELVK
jgi:hypothetical protein